MSLTALLVPTFRQSLRGLSNWLDKAVSREQAEGRDPDALLTQRLAADMYPLATQVRFVCFLSQESIHRLRGSQVPDELLAVRQEGWDAGRAPGTVADAKRHIASALSFLDSLSSTELDATADRAIVLDLPNGMIFDLTGEQFARDWALPQVYFHHAMAYAILRSQGLDLGKADYVGHMLAYVRPGTFPSQG